MAAGSNVVPLLVLNPGSGDNVVPLLVLARQLRDDRGDRACQQQRRDDVAAARSQRCRPRLLRSPVLRRPHCKDLFFPSLLLRPN